MINYGWTTDSILELDRWKLHIKRYCFSVIRIVIHNWYFLEDRFYYDLSCDLRRKRSKIVRQNCGLDNLKVYVDAFVKIGDNKKVIKQEIVTICGFNFPRNWALIRNILNEQEESSKVTKFGYGIIIKAFSVIITIWYLDSDISILVSWI